MQHAMQDADNMRHAVRAVVTRGLQAMAPFEPPARPPRQPRARAGGANALRPSAKLRPPTSLPGPSLPGPLPPAMMM